MKVLIVFALAFASISAANIPTNGVTLQGLELDKIEPQGRIINGEVAVVGQFKYQVGLYIVRPSAINSWCGGSLIGKEWILTAAHCLRDVSNVIAYLGGVARKSGEVTYNVTADSFIIHPEWDYIDRTSDIGLIRIPTTEYSENIQPVKLPAITNSPLLYANEKTVVSGWGSTLDMNLVLSEHLLFARLDAITNAECRESYSGRGIESTHLCTAMENCIAPRKGDSGGPLVLESTQVQVGVVAFGSLLSCKEGIPEVYTRLTSFLQWIEDHTGISY